MSPLVKTVDAATVTVSTHLVTQLQMLITTFLQIAKIQPLAIFPDNVLGTCLTWGRVRPIFYQFFQPGIIRSDLDMTYQILPPFTNVRCFGYFNMDYIRTEMSEQTH
jgi:hypothetical protein